MGTHKILPSLAFEAKLLEGTNEKFPKMVTNFDGNEFVAVNQGFSSLYYFTSEF